MRISDTAVEMVKLVAPQNANPLGVLYGGYMLQWLTDAGTVVAMDLAKSDVVLGFLDRMHFVSPVRIGDILIYRAWAVNVRRSSLTVLVESYVKRSEGVQLATIGRLIFVKVDKDGRPEPLGVELERGEGWEAELYDYFREWRESVEPELRREPAEGERGFQVVSRFLSMPEDATSTGIMYGGKLLYYLDQINAIAAFQFRPRVYVTANVNATSFRRPIRIGDVVEVRVGITYAGRTSLEVGFDVYAISPSERRRVVGGYSTFVSMGSSGPEPLGAEPFGDEEAERRKEESLEEAKALKSLSPRFDEEVPALAEAIARQARRP